MYYPTERRTVFAGVALPSAAVTVLNNIFPLDGMGWTKLRLVLHGIATGAGGAADPFTDGLYRWIKGITFRTSRGEVLCNNVPGMALYWLNSYLNGSAPFHDPIPVHGAGGTEAFCAVLEIPFAFPFLRRGEDTIFDSGRYSNAELQITTGTVADLFTTPGNTVLAVTYDLEIEATLAAMGKDLSGKPAALPYIATYPNILTAVRQSWDIESSLDLGLFGFFIHNHPQLGAAPLAQTPFCDPGTVLRAARIAATGTWDAITNITFVDTVRTWLNLLIQQSFQETRQKLLPFNRYDVPVVGAIAPTVDMGMYPHFFVKNKSFNEAYPTGKKSTIRLQFVNTAAALATDEADLCIFGMRALR
jgi:hypothetical protein